MWRFTGLLTSVLLGSWVVVQPLAAAELTLRFASVNTKDTAPFDQVLVPFARAIEEQTGHRIAIDLQPIGGFGKPVELFSMVEKGQIEIASTVQGYNPGRFPRTSVAELPLIYDTAETGTNTVWSMFEEGLFGPEYDSVKVLSLYALPPYGIFVTEAAPVTSLRELRGLRIRAPGITVGLALARLGAIPIGLPLNMIGDTLNDQLVDGMAFGWDSTLTTHGHGSKMLYEQVGTMIDARFAAPTLMIVMNRKFYEDLAPDLRQIIDRLSGRGLSLASARIRDHAEAEAKQRLGGSAQHHVISLGADDRRAMEQRIAPVFDEWLASMAGQGIDGAALLARARALSAAHS